MPTIIEMLKQDHARVLTDLGTYEAGAGGAVDDVLGVVQRIVGALADHDAIESAILYPAVGRHVPNAPSMLRTALGEHQQMLGLGDGIQRGRLGPMTQYASLVRSHIAFEEGTVFPALGQALTDEELTELGRDAEELLADRRRG